MYPLQEETARFLRSNLSCNDLTVVEPEQVETENVYITSLGRDPSRITDEYF